ncbi:MAG TPA: hypothetical protein VHY09_01945 [Candidatus Methylacidiphilales bacterium]|jgi:hypothetical protein|nr:hypothetical protein [Candidatus Methylacidiphilales bacterium]
MSNRELVIEAVKKLPDDAPSEEIMRQVQFVLGMNEALEQSDREEGISIEEVRGLLEKWTSESSS